MGLFDSSTAAQVRALQRRVDALEATLTEVCRRAGIDPATLPDPRRPDPDVVALAREGKTIAAIKLYRERTGAGLLEAKEVVEGL